MFLNKNSNLAWLILALVLSKYWSPYGTKQIILHFYFKPLCFSCLFPSLPPHTLAAATNTPNAKSTLQAGWHKHSTILAHASLCRGILSETLWHIQASLLSSWGPCLSQSHQQQGALTVNVLPISLRLNQIKQLHCASVHPFPLPPQRISKCFTISLYPATERYCCCENTGCKSLQCEYEWDKKTSLRQAEQTPAPTVGSTEHWGLGGGKGCHSFTSCPWNLQWAGEKSGTLKALLTLSGF